MLIARLSIGWASLEYPAASAWYRPGAGLLQLAG